MHRLVFTMIVTLCAYLLSLRSSGVFVGVTSVGRGCSSIVGEDCVDCIYVFGCLKIVQTFLGLWFLLIGTRLSKTA